MWLPRHILFLVAGVAEFVTVTRAVPPELPVKPVPLERVPSSGTLSFQERSVFANESTGKVEVCVHHTGTIRQFQVYSMDCDAKCETHYLCKDTNTAIYLSCFCSNHRLCFAEHQYDDN